MAAGQGAYPFRSSWISNAYYGGAPILAARIYFSDKNNAEKTVWNNWFFKASSSFQPAWAIPSNFLGTGLAT